MSELETMGKALWITNEIHWDIALYWLFFINVVLLMIQPSGSSTVTILGVIVLMSIMIDKVKAFGYMMDTGPYTPDQCHEQIFIGTYLIRVAMFAVPLSIAGMTKSPKSRGLAVVAGVSGGAYMFVRWYMEQRDVELTDLTCAPTAMIILHSAMQFTGIVFVLARLALRDRLCLGSIHRDIPVTVPFEITANGVEVELS